MFHYSVFGGCLRSDLDFPELPECGDGTPDWTLHTSSRLPAAGPLALIGEKQIDSGVSARLFRTAGGFRVTFDDTGSFDISSDGATILWYRSTDADLEAARLDMIGIVLSVAMHARGFVCLHGSAVAVGNQGIGFVAPKFHGKSTLAKALTAAGAQLATDDTVPIVNGSPVLMRPGVHQVRLWGDSAAHFEGAGGVQRSGYGGKNVVTETENERLLHTPVPLAALYVLCPRQPEADAAAVQRSVLPPIHASLALISHSKLGPLLGATESAVILDRIGDLTRSVPVYRLDIARSFERLDDVVQQLLQWHGEPTAHHLARSA